MEAFPKCITMQNVRLEFRSEKNGRDFISSGILIEGKQVEFQCHTILEPIDLEMNVTLLSETEMGRLWYCIDARVSSSHNCLDDDDEDKGIVMYVSDLQYKVTCKIFLQWFNLIQYYSNEEEGLQQIQNGEDAKNG